MKFIALSGEHIGVALVDDSDYERLAVLPWNHKVNGRRHYARTWHRSGGRTIWTLMHRLILAVPPGMDIDHVNGNGLDNRRSNLRICTRSQNLANSRHTRGTSKFRGVSRDTSRGCWQTGISHQGKRIALGRFDTEEAAARAYDAAALELRGQFARINFPPMEAVGR